MTTTFVTAAEATSEVNHLNACKTPTAINCRERATHRVLILDPGMNMEPVTAELCEWHAAEMIDAGEAEGLDLI